MPYAPKSPHPACKTPVSSGSKSVAELMLTWPETTSALKQEGRCALKETGRQSQNPAKSGYLCRCPDLTGIIATCSRPQTHRDTPVSASQMLGLKVCSTTAWLSLLFLFYLCVLSALCMYHMLAEESVRSSYYPRTELRRLSYHMGAGNRSPVHCKSSWCYSSLSQLSGSEG